MSRVKWLTFAERLSGGSPVRRVIVESWQRSAAAGLERADPLRLHRVSDDELARRLAGNRRLVAAARPHLTWLAATYASIPHVGYVTDREGIVLDSVGDENLKDTFGLAPGYDWSEARMGTNGSGTALAADLPVAVVGPDHYIAAFEDCTCTAAPIHDAGGRLVGAIDLSTRVADGNPERLALVAHVAYMIERELCHEDAATRSRAYRTLAEQLQTRQSELELANARLQLLLDHVPSIVYLVDRHDRFISVNRAWEAQRGLQCDHVVGRTLHEVFPAPVANQFAANNRVVLDSGATRFEETYPVDGVERTYLSLKVPVRDASGQAYAICGISTDITELKRTEAALRASEAALQEADRRKDAFLALVSHELRNPLAPIKYSVHAIRRLASPTAEVARACETIDRQVDYLTRQLDELLDVSRIVHGKIDLQRRRTDLREAVSAALEALCRQFEDRAQHLVLACPDRRVDVAGDPMRLTQVVVNLVQNASKFTPRGGRIDVSLDTCGAEATLVVRDSGVGLSAEALARIFEPFAQAGRAGGGGGLGVGLFLVKSLVELHGGTITVTSAGPDRGSEFVVRLPLARS